MFKVKNTLLAASLIAATLSLGGCAASSGYDAAGYDAIEKNGRLYVFLPGSSAHQVFKRNGEMTKSVTRIGGGPNGMTVVAEPDVNLEAYLASVNKRAQPK